MTKSARELLSPRLKALALWRSLSSEHVNYSSIGGHAGDDGDTASDIDGYKEGYFTPALDTSKHSHLHLEELEIVVSEDVPPLTVSTGLRYSSFS